MSLDISKQSDGSVKFNYGSASDPFIIEDAKGSSVTTRQRSIGGTINKRTFIVISYLVYGKVQTLQFPFTDLTTINGTAKPSTAQASATLLTNSVFNGISGGGGAGTVTSVAGIAPVAGNVPLTGDDLGLRVTTGNIAAGDGPKVITWNTDLVPGDSKSRTYLAKHGSLANVEIFMDVQSPVPGQETNSGQGGIYTKSSGASPTLTLDNQGLNANYIIK